MFDVAMDLTVEERVELSALVHGRDVPAIVATRAQIVLWCTEGRRKKDIEPFPTWPLVDSSQAAGPSPTTRAPG